METRNLLKIFIAAFILPLGRMIQLPMASNLKRCVCVTVITGFFLVAGQWSRAATIYVDGCATGPQDGSQANPYHTLTSAVANSALDDNIIMKGGNYPEDLSIMGQRSIGRLDGVPVIGKDIYNVGWQDVDVPINCQEPLGTYDTRARVYYPARAPGRGTEIDCRGPYPAVVYAHGMRHLDNLWPLCSWCDPYLKTDRSKDYLQAEGIMKRLAASGIVAISVDWFSICDRECAPTYPTPELYDNVATVAISTINYLRSSWEGKIDPQRIGLSGHSTGGGGVIYAAHQLEQNGDPNVKIRGLGLIASVCPSGDSNGPCFEDLDPPGQLFTPPDVPMLLIHGSRDSQGQARRAPLKIYCEQTAAKYLVVVNGANHFGYTDGLCLDPLHYHDYPSEVGSATGQGARKRQQLAAGKYLQAFFSHYLNGNADALTYLLQEDGKQCGYPGQAQRCADELDIPEVRNVIDNGDPGTSFTGNWDTYTGQDTYGADSLYAVGTGSTYTFQFTFSGEVQELDVTQYWTSASDRCTDTQIEISDSTGLLDSLSINQQEDAGENYLGTYQFVNFAMLKVISKNGCYVSADAVSFNHYTGTPPEWLCQPAYTFNELKSVMNVEVNVCSCN